MFAPALPDRTIPLHAYLSAHRPQSARRHWGESQIWSRYSEITGARPRAGASGGSRELIPTIARSCVAAGVDGLFMEVHNDPNSSPVDGPTQWPLRHFPELLAELKAIALTTKARTGQDATIDLTPMEIL